MNIDKKEPEIYTNAMDYLESHKNERRCFQCGKLLEDFEQYICIFCTELIEKAR